MNSVTISSEVGRCGLPRVVFGALPLEPLPEPLVHLLGTHPLQGVDPNQPLDHVSALLRYVLVDVLELALPNLLEQVSLVFRTEGVVSLQDHEQKYAQTPQVGVDWNVVPLRDYFRGHVGRGATEGIDRLWRV